MATSAFGQPNGMSSGMAVVKFTIPAAYAATTNQSIFSLGSTAANQLVLLRNATGPALTLKATVASVDQTAASTTAPSVGVQHTAVIGWDAAGYGVSLDCAAEVDAAASLPAATALAQVNWGANGAGLVPLDGEIASTKIYAPWTHSKPLASYCQ